MSTDPLRSVIADAIASRIYDPAADLSGRLRKECLVYADAVLAALVEHRDEVFAPLGLEQVGWWVEDRHKHTLPASRGVISGEFRFTEEEDGCPLGAVPVYVQSEPFVDGEQPHE